MGADATPERACTSRSGRPRRGSVDVELDSTPSRRVPLERDDDGVWSATLPAPRAGQLAIAIRLNGELARPDPYSRCQPEGVHGPSEVVDPDAFAWHDAGWRGLRIAGPGHLPAARRDRHRPRAPSTALIGAAAAPEVARRQRHRAAAGGRVSRAAATGATTASTCLPPSHVYGGPDAFKRFVDAAHQHGLGVILDVVYNHFGPDGNYLRDFSPDYFTDRYHTPWGDAINYDGPNSALGAQTGARQRRATGCASTTPTACGWTPPTRSTTRRTPHILAELTEAARAAVGPGRAGIVLIAETQRERRSLPAAASTRAASASTRSGPTIFTTRCGAIWRATTRATTPTTTARSTRSRAASSRAGCTRASRRRSSNCERRRGTPARDQPAWQFVYVLQNHDQVGNRAFGERLHHQIDLDRYRAASALLLFLPYTPMLFMGQEFARVVAVSVLHRPQPRAGQAGDRGPAHASSRRFRPSPTRPTRERIPDPQAESTFRATRSCRWRRPSRRQGAELQALYTALLELRQHRRGARRTSRASACSAQARSTATCWPCGAGVPTQERLLLVNFGDARLRDDDFGGGWRGAARRRGARLDATTA